MVNGNPEIRTAVLHSDSPDATRRIARDIGRRCAGGEVILLFGDLGSGKTCFAQGLAAGLDVDPALRVASPTFTLHGEYPGRLVFNHLDLYRLEDPSGLEGLGIDEMLMDPTAVTAVEWPEILDVSAGSGRLEVRLDDLGEGRRRIELAAYGERCGRLVQMLH